MDTLTTKRFVSLLIWAILGADLSKAHKNVWGLLISDKVELVLYWLKLKQLEGFNLPTPPRIEEALSSVAFRIYGPEPASSKVHNTLYGIMCACPETVYFSTEDPGYIEVRNGTKAKEMLKMVSTSGWLTPEEQEFVLLAGQAMADWLIEQANKPKNQST